MRPGGITWTHRALLNKHHHSALGRASPPYRIAAASAALAGQIEEAKRFAKLLLEMEPGRCRTIRSHYRVRMPASIYSTARCGPSPFLKKAAATTDADCRKLGIADDLPTLGADVSTLTQASGLGVEMKRLAAAV
jgi:hypothetical protein